MIRPRAADTLRSTSWKRHSCRQERVASALQHQRSLESVPTRERWRNPKADSVPGYRCESPDFCVGLLAPVRVGPLNSLCTTAIGVQAGTVLRLERKALLESLRTEAALGLALLNAMSLRQRLFINKIAGSQGRISVSGRVAAWLLHRAKMEKSATLSMGVTQETLARQMGISRESLSRELSALASAGLIDRDRRRVTLLDADALRERAEA